MASTPIPKSHRISITVPSSVYQRLARRSFEEGRSISNLTAFLTEAGLDRAESNQTRMG